MNAKIAYESFCTNKLTESKTEQPIKNKRRKKEFDGSDLILRLSELKKNFAKHLSNKKSKNQSL